MMEDYIRLAGIIDDSIVDGPGIRFSIFTQGCLHHCFNCHNKETWDLNGGQLYKIEDLIARIKTNPLLQGITLTGGDPLFQVDACLNLVKKVKADLPFLDILIYTGFTYEILKEKMKKEKNLEELLSLSDFLIDGLYIDSLRDLTLLYRGSKNQRIIDLKKTFLENKVIECEF